MTAWGFVPARGGSKSIRLKNLVEVAGHPLLDYGILAARASGGLDRIICSTDSGQIAERARFLGAEVDWRPEYLSGDAAQVDDVAREYLSRQRQVGAELPDFLVLIQPTSPFLLPQHVVDLITSLAESPRAHSGHTVVAVSHNCHAWNQRLIDPEGMAVFPFLEERSKARNKQEKPKYFIFGNLIASRTEALLAGEGFYAAPCLTVQIERPYEFDLDGPQDLIIAESLLRSKAVFLPHMGQ